jgi:hypothetical protein
MVYHYALLKIDARKLKTEKYEKNQLTASVMYVSACTNFTLIGVIFAPFYPDISPHAITSMMLHYILVVQLCHLLLVHTL